MSIYALWWRVLAHDRKDKIMNTRKSVVLVLGWLSSSLETGAMSWDTQEERLPPGHLPGEVFQGRPSGRRPPGKNLGQLIEIIVLGWPGSTSGHRRQSWWKWLGSLTVEAAGPTTLPTDKRLGGRHTETENIYQHIHAGSWSHHWCIICSEDTCALSYAGRHSGLVPRLVVVGLTHTGHVLSISPWPQTSLPWTHTSVQVDT